jgi:hypothetical protein
MKSNLAEDSRHEAPIGVFNESNEFLYAATGVSGADNRAGACSGHERGTHADLGQIAEDAQMREAAATATAEGYAHGRRSGESRGLGRAFH